MKVFKFGGASVKDAQGVENIAKILSLYRGEHIILVISAMGKMTNHFEKLLQAYIQNEAYTPILEEIESYHLSIANELMPDNQAITSEINQIFLNLNLFFNTNKSPKYDFIYDQVVSKGEILSTKIVSAYLNDAGIDNAWLDARDYIKTDSTYREGQVNWEETAHKLQTLNKDKLYIIQGFIGSNDNYFTTTLGREGSDYTGAILAHCLDAESLTIWKDVAGVLNADPRYFTDTTKLNHISYEEAIELAFYGASVIHPKTLQPLKNKNIPLYVKSFEKPRDSGTVIKVGELLEPKIPCYIVKREQHILQISTHSFAFIDEKVIRDVFQHLAEFQLKVNLMQISAISLSLCIEDKFNRLDEAIDHFKEAFKVDLVKDCTLYTVRHYKDTEGIRIPNVENALIQQIRKSTLQIVVKDESN
ncbi:MAG: aspartate kinase [Weeksellaceae bacterium]